MQGVHNQNKIQLSDHFSYGRLIRFTLPSIIIMIFASFYGVVDGYFVSNYVGKTAFASINMIIPFIQIISGMGVIFGADGSSLIARTMGAGNREKAGRYFTMTMIATAFGGVLFTVVGLVVLSPVAYYLGATKEMITDCVTYGKICIMFSAAQLGQNILLGYLIVAEKPKFASRIMVCAFLLNIVLDILFIHPRFLNMGVTGAALATGISQTFVVLTALFWFLSKKNRTPLRFRRTKIDVYALRKASYTGSAEAISTLAASIVGFLYNIQLMKYLGSDAVAAYGIVLYVSFVFTNVYTGYSVGCSPIIGYDYGAGRQREMRNVLKMSMLILAVATTIMVCLTSILARPIATIFIGYDWTLLSLTTKIMMICVLPFLFMWINVYLSAVFSAIGKGATSAVLTALRVLVFPVVCIVMLPWRFGLEGVWYAMYAMTGAEALSAMISLIVLLTQKKKFGR